MFVVIVAAVVLVTFLAWALMAISSQSDRAGQTLWDREVEQIVRRQHESQD
jgi:hypothetical protein